jgi:hypothetical protein
MTQTFQEIFFVPIKLHNFYPTPHAASVPFVDAARALQAKIDKAFPTARVVHQTISLDENADGSAVLEALVMFEIITPQGA